MALDPAFMSFGISIAKGVLENKQIAVQNAAVAASNELVQIQAAEQAGYAATNFSLSLEEIQRAELSTAVARMQAAGQATVESATFGTSREEADLRIAQDTRNTAVAQEEAKRNGRVNYLNTRKGIQAQAASGQKLGIPESGILEQVLSAGSATYFDALKSGLIS